MNLWIGLWEPAGDSVFERVSGDPSAFRDWAPGEPNEYVPDEDFVNMQYEWGVGGQWNDVTDDHYGLDAVYGVVEITPEPTTAALLLMGLLGLGVARRRASA